MLLRLNSRRRDCRIFHTQRARACDSNGNILNLEELRLIFVCVTTYAIAIAVYDAKVEGSFGHIEFNNAAVVSKNEVSYFSPPKNEGHVSFYKSKKNENQPNFRLNTLEDIQITLDAFDAIRTRLENGTYQRLSAAVMAAMGE